MIAFGGMLLLILYLILQTGTFINALPIIALYAYAGYRLLPAIQLIYSAVTQLRYLGPALDTLHKDIKSLTPYDLKGDQKIISLKKISLNSIDYNYPNSSRIALKNINLEIPVNKTVAIVGATGSGKTTLVDIILGLLEAQKGTLEVDGEVINKQNSKDLVKIYWLCSPKYIFI